MTTQSKKLNAILELSGWQREAAYMLARGRCAEPHALLGCHRVDSEHGHGVIIRAWHPDAIEAHVVIPRGSVEHPMVRLTDDGLFGVFLPTETTQVRYQIRFRFATGGEWLRDDPYRFLPSLGDMDLYYFNEGTHRTLWKALGSHVHEMAGAQGVRFAVWAPSAAGVSVVGPFNRWDGRIFPMRQLGSSGVFELFIPGIGEDELYKYEIRTPSGDLRLKCDPMAQYAECPPATASRVCRSTYHWGDQAWLAARDKTDINRSPVSIYEMHLGSWRRIPEENNRPLTYRELAKPLIEHLQRFHFTHVEFMPLAEHPFGGSWGYQVTGYYAPTSRYGTPDDFRYLIDQLHQAGIGVILDWVPAHFPKDDFALRRFDGTALYEHEDPRQGEHPDWGTLIFNYGRMEVRNFLIANALYWLKEFHIDGLRVDAVASMLYLDYSRSEGGWIPNSYGGRENIEAIEFLRTMNHVVAEECPGCSVMAEESTGWSGVTRSTDSLGLGFTLKWNMGWMHDTLQYFSRESIHRRYHHHELTFSMIYEHSEQFLNPLSHDEVVHGKRSLLDKMPGDIWQKFANLRALIGYQYTRPGKKLLFMGTELAPWTEWYYDASLDWHLAQDPMRSGFATFLETLGALYVAFPCLWQSDPDYDGFRWIDCNDHEQSVFSWVRQTTDQAGQPAWLVIVMNLTPIPRDRYRIGVPAAARYECILNSDHHTFGGSGYPSPQQIHVDHLECHGFDRSVELRLPPLSMLVLRPHNA